MNDNLDVNKAFEGMTDEEAENLVNRLKATIAQAAADRQAEKQRSAAEKETAQIHRDLEALSAELNSLYMRPTQNRDAIRKKEAALNGKFKRLAELGLEVDVSDRINLRVVKHG